MTDIDTDIVIFAERAAAELIKANPGLEAGAEISQDMIDAAFAAVLERDQTLVKAVGELPVLQDVLCLEAYNACRVEGLKQDHNRQLEDERRAGNLRLARMELLE